MEANENNRPQDVHRAPTSQEQALIDRCVKAEDDVSKVDNAYREQLGWNPLVLNELTRLGNRAREYEHGTFIVLVVGPAKSGKSTLVNLIAGGDVEVSPTSFLECTVRPSVISRRNDNPGGITVYTTQCPERRLEQVDAIIDTIRGFGTGSDLDNVESTEYELSNENIKKHVELGLKESLKSDTLLTSIRTPGGILLQKDVFIIDMPGFDGSYANIDNPTYEAIAQRADLIFFVQSSNAAFSKVSRDFLKILARTNQNVQICLIHNIFDAAHWRPEERKQADIDEQMSAAISEIRNVPVEEPDGRKSYLNFSIDAANAYAINLGAVTDYRKSVLAGEPLAILEPASVQFDQMEKDMHDRIIHKRDTMRLNNTLSRTAQLRNKIVAGLDAEIADRNALMAKYNSVAEELKGLEAATITASEPDTPDRNVVYVDVDNICANCGSQIGPNVMKTRDEAIGFVAQAVDMVENMLNGKIPAYFGLDVAADEMYTSYKNGLSSIVLKLSSYPGASMPEQMEQLEPSVSTKFSLVSQVVPENFVPKLYYKIPFTDTDSFIQRKHTGIQILGHISNMRQYLIPAIGPMVTPGTGLIYNGVPAVKASAAAALQAVADAYNASIRKYVARVSSSILDNIIPNPEEFARQTQQLESLRAALKEISL